MKLCLKDVKFNVLYDTKEISKFCFSKDKIPINQNADIVYQFTCPGCNKAYIYLAKQTDVFLHT